MRSVHSAKTFNPRGPSRPRFVVIWIMAWPDWMRRCQASSEVSKSPSSGGIVRVALLPS